MFYEKSQLPAGAEKKHEKIAFLFVFCAF